MKFSEFEKVFYAAVIGGDGILGWYVKRAFKAQLPNQFSYLEKRDRVSWALRQPLKVLNNEGQRHILTRAQTAYLSDSMAEAEVKWRFRKSSFRAM